MASDLTLEARPTPRLPFFPGGGRLQLGQFSQGHSPNSMVLLGPAFPFISEKKTSRFLILKVIYTH